MRCTTEDVVQPQGNKVEYQEMEEGFCGSGTSRWEDQTVRHLPSVEKILVVEIAPSVAPTRLFRLSFLGMKPTPFFLGGICTSFSEGRTSLVLWLYISRLCLGCFRGDYCFIYLLGCSWHQFYAGFGGFSYFRVWVLVWLCRALSWQANGVPASCDKGWRGCWGGSENPWIHSVVVFNQFDLLIMRVRQPALATWLMRTGTSATEAWPWAIRSCMAYLSHLCLLVSMNIFKSKCTGC